MALDELTYDDVGVTQLESPSWDRGRHRLETTVRLGAGEECWLTSSTAVLDWAVKTRSGFQVLGGCGAADLGRDYELGFRLGPVRVREPVRVVGLVREQDRCGFAYGTLRGHPVSGEEAFVVHRDAAGQVFLTIRSFTLPAPGWRTAAFPIFLVAQQALRHRYIASLVV